MDSGFRRNDRTRLRRRGRCGGRLAADHASSVVGHAGLRSLDLALAGEAFELEPDLVGLGAAGGADGVALGEEAAAGVDGDAATDLGDALVDEAAARAVVVGGAGVGAAGEGGAHPEGLDGYFRERRNPQGHRRSRPELAKIFHPAYFM
jgi:hypothetical protein